MDFLGLARAGVDVIKEMVPPREIGERLYKWCVFIAVMTGVTALASLTHILWACGWLSIFGLNGFALADEARDAHKTIEERRVQLDAKVTSTQILLLNAAMKEALRNRCVAIIQNNQDALDGANRDIEYYGNQYFDVTKRYYVQPTCDVILIAKKS